MSWFFWSEHARVIRYYLLHPVIQFIYECQTKTNQMSFYYFHVKKKTLLHKTYSWPEVEDIEWQFQIPLKVKFLESGINSMPNKLTTLLHYNISPPEYIQQKQSQCNSISCATAFHHYLKTSLKIFSIYYKTAGFCT